MASFVGLCRVQLWRGRSEYGLEEVRSRDPLRSFYSTQQSWASVIKDQRQLGWKKASRALILSQAWPLRRGQKALPPSPDSHHLPCALCLHQALLPGNLMGGRHQAQEHCSVKRLMTAASTLSRQITASIVWASACYRWLVQRPGGWPLQGSHWNHKVRPGEPPQTTGRSVWRINFPATTSLKTANGT